jgi:hypothetical protein
MCFLPWQCYKNNLLLRCPNPRMYPISSLICAAYEFGIGTHTHRQYVYVILATPIQTLFSGASGTLM